MFLDSQSAQQMRAQERSLLKHAQAAHRALGLLGHSWRPYAPGTDFSAAKWSSDTVQRLSGKRGPFPSSVRTRN